jgi:hypothetical protein
VKESDFLSPGYIVGLCIAIVFAIVVDDGLLWLIVIADIGIVLFCLARRWHRSRKRAAV